MINLREVAEALEVRDAKVYAHFFTPSGVTFGTIDHVLGDGRLVCRTIEGNTWYLGADDIADVDVDG